MGQVRIRLLSCPASPSAVSLLTVSLAGFVAALVTGCAVLPVQQVAAHGADSSSAPTTPAPTTPAPTTPAPTTPESAPVAHQSDAFGSELALVRVDSSGAGAAIRVAPASGSWGAVPGSSALALESIDGGRIALLWMDPARLSFRFVPGREVPEGGVSLPQDSQPATWTKRIVAAFNGGFRLRDGVGGYWYDGHQQAALRPGYASLVINRDGSMVVGQWGTDVSMLPAVLVVRQNMLPLIAGGRSKASATDGPRKWGIANANRPTANRSALAELADGSFVFGFGHNVSAVALAEAMVAVGAQRAIMLDMNISWPTGFVYRHESGRIVGQRISPFVVRPPSSYLTRFRKDFVAVESK